MIYALDANGSFGSVVDTLRFLNMTGEVPPCYVVGIGYRMGGLHETLNVRCRDYTPTRFPTFEEFAPKMWPGATGPIVTGGGPAFLRFIREELKPYVEREFSVAPDDATISGASFGGLFPTYTLLNRPDTFQRYILCSPSLLYDGEVMFRQEEAYAATHRDLAARVFVCCGALENAEEYTRTVATMPPALQVALDEIRQKVWEPRMVELVEPFVARLVSRKYPNLRLASHIFADENHNSVYPAAVSRGLRTVFGRLG